MIDVPANFIARPYRGVSVQEVPSLEPGPLREHVLSRRVYRRTEFLVAEHGEAHAVLQVERDGEEEILVGVRDVRVLAAPDEVVFIDDERVDTGNATQMAHAALESGRPARVYVVQGRFQHVNIIVSPAPLAVRVVEVVPPEPPKLLEMAKAMLDADEDLPPIDLEFVAIDLRDLIARNPAARYLLPCRSGGLDPSLPVEFLDAGPPVLRPWTLIGCERSRQIHTAMYGAEPHVRVDFCPRTVVGAGEPGPTLMKCCIRERGIERRGDQVLVPWGATLDEVRGALRMLSDLPPVPPPAEVLAA
ncbi:MAG: hypothetical protein QOJ21_3978 [Solirubrobacteraceae bacterium]|jgi:hypothetical protein|nr:hypothetical protein [Solirubrobacteraceae bacterium]